MMKIQMPFYKYRILLSGIKETNAFDMLYAKTCIYLNKKNGRYEYDVGEQSLADTKNALSQILGDNIIEKIENKVDSNFLEKSCRYIQNDESDIDQDNSKYIYQDAVSGMVMPCEKDNISEDENTGEECDIKILLSDSKILKNTQRADIENIKEALRSCDKYADKAIVDNTKVIIQYKEKGVVYQEIDINVRDNKLVIISPFSDNEDCNADWLNWLKNSGNKDIDDIINKISKGIKEDTVFIKKTRTKNNYPRNSKLNELYHLFENLEDNKELIKDIFNADSQRYERTGFMANSSKILDRLCLRIQLPSLELNRNQMEKEIKDQIRYVRKYYPMALKGYKPRENQTEEDVVHCIYKKMLDNKERLAKLGQGLYTRIIVYKTKEYTDLSNDMNYYDFLENACELYGVRNSELHIEKEKKYENMSSKEIIDMFYNVCKFLYNLIIKQ